jgi:colanic acid/amylovoran biosynthesis glycosyltransferase
LSGKVLSRLQRWSYPDFLAQTALESGARVLHSHFGNRGWLDIKAARRAGLKHVVTFYGSDVNRLPVVKPWWRQRYRALFEQVDCVLCEGPHMAQCIVNLGCPEHKVHVHHLGIEVEKIVFKPRVWNPDEPLRVLMAAAFREKKGIPYALEALGHLQHRVPLEITIVGDATSTTRSQAEKQRILTTIENHQLESRVRMLGYQSHTTLFEQAYEHHIFLSPSVTAGDGDTEGGAPIAIIEMTATGMPIVSTKHCDIPGVVQPDLVNLLAEERDVDGLVRYIEWLIEHREQWPGILEAGRKHIEAEFDVRLQGQRLTGIYRNLVNE